MTEDDIFQSVTGVCQAHLISPAFVMLGLEPSIRAQAICEALSWGGRDK